MSNVKVKEALLFTFGNETVNISSQIINELGVLVDLKFQFSLDSLNKMKYEILLAVLPSSPAELAAYLSR